ncbi:YegP family protein [Halorussus salilacus]|uniref:HVO_2922 family protein n=1 Tax=Halorussus salilacus TaxID=2953750 RepID=UPI0020A1CE2D|nr:HVO_2922 family protein [Halorussus salilacus]USZ69097.1 YegP family protein [Halorussus salilacus]
MLDREYTLVAHPRLRARLSYRTADGDLTAATLQFDYRPEGEWTETGPAVDLPEHPEDAGVEWQGFDIALYRDGEAVFARETSSSLLSDLADAVDAVERYAPGVARRGRAAVRGALDRLARGRVEMAQSDGTTLEALAPAKAAFEVYEGRDGKWRWRLVHDNGNVVADSGQGYASKQSARKGIRSVKRNALGAPVEPVGGDPERDVRSGSDAENEGPEEGAAES